MKKSWFGLITAIMLIGFMTTAVFAEDTIDDWDGSSDVTWYNDTDTEFTITTAEQLAGLAELVDGGNTFEGKTIKLGTNIDLYAEDENGEKVSFDPIGYGYDIVFKGTFDGQDKTISNLYQNGWALGLDYSTEGGGLFASVVDATIKNVNIDNAEVVMECIDMGILVGYSYGECVYENISITNSLIANYQRYTGGVVGEVNGTQTFKNIYVDENTVISSLWGDFDCSLGGIIGGKYGDATITPEDCYVACEINAYNDVTSSYQWYAYRRAGMLIGNAEDTATTDGHTSAAASYLTAKNCTVIYGDWVHYTYCAFAGTSWPYVRVQEGYSNSAYSNPRYGHPTDANGNEVVDDNHVHNEGEDHFIECTFDQLYGGGQGVYGEPTHDGVTVIHHGEEPVAAIGRSLYLSLTDAISAANAADSGAVITLLKDVTLGEKLTITGDVTMSGEYTITRADDYTGTLFAVEADATLTLDDGLTIDGGNEWTLNEENYNKALNREISDTVWSDFVAGEVNAPNATAAMFIVKGSVIAGDVTVQNNFSTKDSNSGDGGIFKVETNASLTMNGAQIKHIATGGANSVAHLASGAVWTINEGTVISDTFAGRNGGVCRNDSGSIVMNGGEIKDNRSWNTNGTVFMMYQGSFEMNDGLICSNSGVSGSANGRCSAIYLHASGVFTMNGGSICHNTGISYGGVDTNKTTSVLTVTGGYIGENISVLGNENKDVNMYANSYITGGTFTQDVTEFCAIGYEAKYIEELGVYGIEQYYAAEYKGVKYLTIQDAINAVGKGSGTVKILKDHEVDVNVRLYTHYPVLINGSDITLDLNGKTVTFDYSKKTGEAVYSSISIYNGGSLTILDSSDEQTGTLYNKNAIDEAPRIVWVTSAGSLVIEGGRFISEQGDTMFYTSNSNADVPTTLYVKGGYFEHTIPTDGGTYDCFNQQDGYKEQIIELSGGTFNHDPTTGRQNDWEVTIAPNYKVIDNGDGTYTVGKEGNIIITFANTTLSTKTIPSATALEAVREPKKDGYIFAGWYVNEALTREFDFSTILYDDTTIYAKWEKDTDLDLNIWYMILLKIRNQIFEVTADTTDGGTITPEGITEVKYDNDITYTITPDEGYVIADVIVDGESVGAVSEYTFKGVREAHTITVVFGKSQIE